MRCLLPILFVLNLSAQQDEPLLFKTEVSLVRVDARVARPNGATVSGLRAEDFVIYDESQPVKPVDFASETEAVPVNVMLLLDVSESMRPYLSELSEKASEALRVLRAGDRVAVMLFAQESTMVQPFTTQLGMIPERIVNSIFKQSGTRATFVNRALVEAAKQLGTQKGRRALLVVTDNDNFRDTVGDTRVLEALQRNDIVMNAIIAGNSSVRNAGAYTNPESNHPDIARFAEATGGSVLRKQPAASALRGLLQEVVSRYVLQYPAPAAAPGSTRKIRVELSASAKARYPGAEVQARSEYEVGGLK